MFAQSAERKHCVKNPILCIQFDRVLCRLLTQGNAFKKTYIHYSRTKLKTNSYTCSEIANIFGEFHLHINTIILAIII